MDFSKMFLLIAVCVAMVNEVSSGTFPANPPAASVSSQASSVASSGSSASLSPIDYDIQSCRVTCQDLGFSYSQLDGCTSCCSCYSSPIGPGSYPSAVSQPSNSVTYNYNVNINSQNSASTSTSVANSNAGSVPNMPQSQPPNMNQLLPNLNQNQWLQGQYQNQWLQDSYQSMLQNQVRNAYLNQYQYPNQYWNVYQYQYPQGGWSGGYKYRGGDDDN